MPRAIALSFLLASATAQAPLALHLFDPAASPSARCLDGSRAGYYYRASPSNSSKWVVFLQGGGSCATYADCLARAASDLGSSKRWAPTFVDADNLLSVDPTVNPAFSEAHHVFLPYCTGDVHIGSRVAPLNASWPFYFSGHHNVLALLRALTGGGPLGGAFSAAASLLLAGSSAGGMGTLLNAEAVKAGLPASVALSLAPQGGWFFPEVSPYPIWAAGGNAPVWAVLEGVAALWAPWVVPACAAQFNASYCLSVGNMYRFVTSPAFVAENLVDSNQVFVELQAPASGPRVPAFVAYFHAAMAASLKQVRAAASGLWAPACIAHTENLNFRGNGTTVEGWSYRDALAKWAAGGGAVVLEDTCADPLPCNPTCPKRSLLPAAGEGPLVPRARA